MIKDIKLKFGRAVGLEAVTIEATPITVFVGPNNSGKSIILSEIQQFCGNGNRNTNTVPGKPKDDLAPGTLSSILKQAGLR
jgi:ABC-type enterochelin transport system ATPase subunit